MTAGQSAHEARLGDQLNDRLSKARKAAVIFSSRLGRQIPVAMPTSRDLFERELSKGAYAVVHFSDKPTIHSSGFPMQDAPNGIPGLGAFTGQIRDRSSTELNELIAPKSTIDGDRSVLPSFALRRRWRSINPLQQKNPCGVGQRIGRDAEIDASVTQVSHEHRHRSIKS